MSGQFALWITIIMSGVLLIGVTWILTDRIVELRHRVNRLEIYRRLDEDEKFWEKTPKREWVGLSSLDKTFLRTAYAQLRPLYHDKKEDVSVAAEVVTDWDGFFAAIDAKLKEKNLG